MMDGRCLSDKAKVACIIIGNVLGALVALYLKLNNIL